MYARLLTVTVLFGCLAFGCSSEATDSPEQEPQLSVEWDTSVVPVHTELEGFEGNSPRPVAALSMGEGHQVEFVENELVVVTEDSDALEALMQRWGGVKLDSRSSPAEDDQLGPIHLIRVDTTSADTASLAADLLAVNPEAVGKLRVSSQSGLALLAAAAQEAKAGVSVAVNWIGRGDDLTDQECTEAPGGPAGYSTNPFDWSFYDTGSTQDIGVAEAWRALALTNRLQNKVKIAVIDMGFAPDADFPSGWRGVSIVPGKQPTGTENTWGCGGGPCPWHGTNVSSTVAARVNNSFGSAGVAGPVADLLMIYSGYDYYSAIAALLVARGEGARIVNMSFGARVPTIVAWTVYPFEWATEDAWNHGHLIFAASGNDGENVDAEYKDAFGTSWGEKAWHTPCENKGVICVGGLAWGSTDAHSDSNYGGENVDVWAPYEVWVGPDPDNTGNLAHGVSGTSFSSPFAAGVAALIWAADPGQSARDVRDVLYATAHSSADNRVKRYVNAYDAVTSVLGEQDPFVEITDPPDGSEWMSGNPVYFAAIAGDLEDGIPQILWTSSTDGILGSGTSITRDDLSYGLHEITATAFDLGGNMVSDVITITITNTAPEVQIIEPLTGSQFVVGESVTLRGESTDLNYYPSFDLPDSAMVWASNIDGVLGSGHEITTTLTQAQHLITLTGTDDAGAFDTDSITVTVAPAGGDAPPSVSITTPDHDVEAGGSDWMDWQYDGYDAAAGMPYKDVTLVGLATDDVDGTLSGASMVWTTDQTAYQDALLGTGAAITVRLYGGPCSATHTITLTATDSAGQARTAVRIIRLWVVC